MSETLKTGGEKPAENTEAMNRLEILTEMSDEFDPDKARDLIERDNSETVEQPEPEEEAARFLAVMPEKQEKELSPEDAANEYLALLDELSQNFSNPFYKNGAEHGGDQHGAGGIVRDLGRKYSDNPHYRHLGYMGTEANGKDYIDYTVERMTLADEILESEINWRTVDKNAKKEAEKENRRIDGRIADLDHEYARKGLLGKLFGKRKYEEARKNLEQNKTNEEAEASELTGKYNAKIRENLAYAYNETGRKYDMNKEIQQNNEVRNRQFFGLDDPERAKKVERAIELRQKYEAEWSKKNK